ncbi:GGDEF domain-containing protein [Ideonella sp. YS5]|uniref:GGDEF domain-containing protein n=1 Tax=Ideonella sp. YS5 TaxID=3453714 RepID=UPI003EE97E28
MSLARSALTLMVQEQPARLGDAADFEQTLSALCESAPLSALSVVILELDGFERLVLRHGPSRAEDCLRQVAVIVQDGLGRVPAQAFRLEGPRFGLLLPSTNASMGQSLAEALRRRIAAQVTSFDGRMVRLTATTGAASRVQGTRCGAKAMREAAETALAQARASQACHVCVRAPVGAA